MRSRSNRAMPWLWLGAAAVGLTQTQPPKTDEKPASVQGEVRNSVTGMLIERAHVSLRRYNSGGFDKYGGLTNAEGKFRITGMPAGSYMLTLDRVGYVASLEMTRSPVMLAPDEKKDNLQLKLVPMGAISGRVLDAGGQPVDGLQVHAEQGERTMHTGVTDDRGQYRIGGLDPGRYRVRTQTQNLPVPPEIRTDGTTEILYADTYHPGALDAKGAARVVVGPGSDVTGIDIRLVRAAIIRMAGRVTGMPEGSKNVYVQVTRANGGQGAQVKPDGSFEIWRPDPGKYKLRAMCNDSGEMLGSAVVEVEVGDSDIDNILLTLVAPEDIRGQLEFEDEGAREAQMLGGPAPTRVAAQGTPQAPPPRPPRRILFREVSSMIGQPTGDVSEDGAFTVPKVSPGKYIVSTQGYPGYVKSIRMGDTASDGPALNLNQGSGGARVTVTLSSAFGEVGGTVRDDKGPAAGARVVLQSTLNTWMPLYSESQADGTYSFKSVAPGTYVLLAMDESEIGAADYDGAETVEVRPRETLTRDLKVRPLR
jgi:hypothetical protein